MHPDLLNNSTFLRYYERWQSDPSSIVFAPIAEYFLSYNLVDDALKVCRAGLKQHPDLVSGKIVMAKIHMRRGNWEEAEEYLRSVLNVVPSNEVALKLMEEVQVCLKEDRTHATERMPSRAFIPLSHDEIEEPLPTAPPQWSTVTMARVYAAQGHLEQARTIYRAILDSDPQNEAATAGLAELSGPASGVGG